MTSSTDTEPMNLGAKLTDYWLYFFELFYMLKGKAFHDINGQKAEVKLDNMRMIHHNPVIST